MLTVLKSTGIFRVSLKFLLRNIVIFSGALFVLVVHLPWYTFDSPESYQKHVGQWIFMIAARIPRARILVVPTHIDECPNQEEIDVKCKNILTNMREQLEEMAWVIDNKSKHMKKTEKHCKSPEGLAKILEKHREQKDNLPVISLQYKVRHLRPILAKLFSPFLKIVLRFPGN